MDLEAPPPDPELPPADCDDAVDDVAAADEVDDVDDVADVAEDDVAALDGVAVTAAVEDAIALIDMKTSSEGTLRAQRWRDLFFPFNGGRAGSRRRTQQKKRRGASALSERQPILPPRVAGFSRLPKWSARSSLRFPGAMNGQSFRLTSV
ncbi:hypothetical protein GCM10010987_26610 [Bradyrhizobium guangdongense]|uniref:Uncharacterized protein n=2 Tax=Bradyrhizobium guangdongense TaxID=1325090 RepID=A0AA87W808_9BRAD|nr:hypothetical protein GCM10010987_26610 [Bradyrhizobium guangdongense]